MFIIVCFDCSDRRVVPVVSLSALLSVTVTVLVVTVVLVCSVCCSRAKVKRGDLRINTQRVVVKSSQLWS
jgi:hypothetical protein